MLNNSLKYMFLLAGFIILGVWATDTWSEETLIAIIFIFLVAALSLFINNYIKKFYANEADLIAKDYLSSFSSLAQLFKEELHFLAYFNKLVIHLTLRITSTILIYTELSKVKNTLSLNYFKLVVFLRPFFVLVAFRHNSMLYRLANRQLWLKQNHLDLIDFYKFFSNKP